MSRADLLLVVLSLLLAAVLAVFWRVNQMDNRLGDLPGTPVALEGNLDTMQQDCVTLGPVDCWRTIGGQKVNIPILWKTFCEEGETLTACTRRAMAELAEYIEQNCEDPPR